MKKKTIHTLIILIRKYEFQSTQGTKERNQTLTSPKYLSDILNNNISHKLINPFKFITKKNK